MQTIKRKLGILEVKQALLDGRFRNLFPEFKEQIDKFIKDPGCPCNRKLYDELFNFPDRLATYFPNREIMTTKQEIEHLANNQWTVINCHITELENKLRKLQPGRKNIAIARYDDQVTVIVNDLGMVF